MASTKTKPRKVRGDTLFPGIGRHAEKLGCNRTHLYLVLIGSRPNDELIRRYKALVLKEGKSVPNAISAA